MNHSEDQRNNTGMEDSTAMTIEFLRARLLSERSVSRTARQRADELAQRVLELEEQLKIVSVQRNKAEKATADVLSILENHSISDVSREFDSSSDQEETLCDSNVGDGSTKEGESSVNSKSRRNDADRLSTSELEFSPSTNRRLSWKSSKDSSRSIEKRYLDSSIRRRRGFASSGSSSPKHNLGKSCRQIRRIETSSEDPDEEKILREGSENPEEEVLVGRQVSDILESKRDSTSSNHHLNQNGRNGDMERALEHQAQLIGKYEAEEKAQREWEEKFRENNSSTPDSCEPGNHSDITEERDEVNPQAPSAAGIVSSQDQEMKLDDNVVCLQGQNHSSALACEFAFPMAKEDQQQFLGRDSYHLSDDHYPYSQTAAGDHSTHAAHRPLQVKDHPVDVMYHPKNVRDHPGGTADHSAHATDYSGHITHHSEHAANHSAQVPAQCYVGSKGESSGSQDKHYALVPHEASNKLSGVLEALQQAKLSIQHKINRLPLIEHGSVGRAMEPSFPSTRAWDRVEVPVGCAGLFRVPTDFQLGTAIEADYLGSESWRSLKNYYPDTGFVPNAGDQFLTSPCLQTGSSVPADGRFLTFPYRETGPSIPSLRPSFEHYRDPGLSASARYPYPPYSSHPDVPPQASFNGGFPRSLSNRETGMPSNGGFQRPPQNGEVGMPSTDHFSFYEHHIRPTMYR